MANCENFTIHLFNDTGVEIRATKFEYRDGTRSKTENMFGINGGDRIDSGGDERYVRNLQGIGSENTEFTVTYQQRQGTHNWSSNQVHTTGTFRAEDNGHEDIHITG
ncbi:hypothetical protein [Granulicoccus phenolivorans]|uniref:hypothetical protein n=1 Tax=Granulicoccus phenolivorans TaxID=266854 RepID=UPI00041FE51C|nr:hypothetical protein [Granulicoccus phenolivorans]